MRPETTARQPGRPAMPRSAKTCNRGRPIMVEWLSLGQFANEQGDRAMLNFPYPLNIMFPGAAGNWQAFDARFLSPNVSVNFAGNPTVEREVTEDVASFGTQIGWLNDIVSALAAAAGDSLDRKPKAR
jgi:hypothetical protein